MLETVDVDPAVAVKPKPSGPGPGSRLREAREARNLSVADVKSALRLRDGVIEALECDDYHELPAPIFVKGYLRSYARLVGVGEEPVLAQYQAREPDDPPPLVPVFPGATGFQPKVSLTMVLGALSILLVIGALFMIKSGKQAPPVAETAVSRNMVADPAGTGAGRGAEPLTVDPATAAEPESAGMTMDPESIQMLAEPEMMLQHQDGDPNTESTVPVNSAEKVLQLGFDDDCWTEIQDRDGRRLIYGLLPAGTTRTVSGLPPFSVVLGNASAVHVNYNGEAYDISPFVRQNIARFQLGQADVSDGD